MAESSESYRDPKTLRRLYHERDLTTGDIAERFGVSDETIRKWMDRYDIERRATTAHRNPRRLRHLYVEEGMSAPAIAAKLGVSHTTIYKWLDRHDIETRDHSEATEATWDVLHERPGLLEYDDWLTWRQSEVVTLVVRKDWSVAEAADHLDVHADSVRITLGKAADRLQSVAAEQSG